MTLAIAATLLVAAGAVAAFVSGRYAFEFVGLGLIAVLLVLFQVLPVPGPGGDNLLGPGAILSGFANTGLLTLVALLVIARGLVDTGALTRIADLLNRGAARRRTLALLAFLLVAAVASGFINNTPIVLMFIPVFAAVSSPLLPPSRLLLPLSYASILGGMTTLVGSSTNLVAAGVAMDLGLPPFGFFAFTVPGLVVAGAGLAYVLLVLPWLLPRRPASSDDAGAGRQFVTELEVRADSPLVGERAESGMFRALPDATVFSVRRRQETFLTPFEGVELRGGDILVVAVPRHRLLALLDHLGGPFRGAEAPAVTRRGHAALLVTDAAVAPDSPLTEDPPLGPEIFRLRTGCSILGIRRSARTGRDRRAFDTPLRGGDVLAIQGTQAALNDLRGRREVILVGPVETAPPAPRYVGYAVAIFLGTILAASTGIVPIVVAAGAGAFLMLATGVLDTRQMIDAVDSRVVLPVAAMLGLSHAMQATGAAEWIAGGAVGAMQGFGFGTAAMMSALFLLVALTTDTLTNNAAALLYMPVAVGMAQILGVDPFPFAVTVILAANMSFSTPIGYQTNLLVMEPGGYRPLQYLRSGPPLTLICWGAFTLFVPWYYGIS